MSICPSSCLADGSRVHLLDEQSKLTAATLLASRKGVVKSTTMLADIALHHDTLLDMDQGLGGLARETINNPHKDPGTGYSTVSFGTTNVLHRWSAS